MALSPMYEKICATEKPKIYTENIKLETKTDIATDDIKRIINISAFTVITHSELADNKISVKGKNMFFLCYENGDREIKKCEIPAEFCGDIEISQAENCKFSVSSSVVKTEANASNIKLELSAVICLKAQVKTVVERNALCGGESLVCDMAEYSIKKGLGTRKIVFPIEEEFEIGLPIEEVIFHRAEPIITAVQCGVGCIIVDGEVRLSAILLQNGEKRGIIVRENKVLPYRAEIEYDEAMPILGASARVELKSFKTDITVDSESGRSLVSASVTLQFEGEAFQTDTVNLARDVFSVTDETEVQKSKISIYQPLDMHFYESSQNLTVSFAETEQDKILRAISGEKVEIVTTEVQDDALTITGSVEMTGYFFDNEEKIYARKLETPFECNLDVGFKNNCVVGVNGCCEIAGFTAVGQGADVSVKLNFAITPERESELYCVDDVKAISEKQVETSAISVYLSYKGEELWSLCKRLNQTPEGLMEFNKELNFPLSGEERIVVYRQKQ